MSKTGNLKHKNQVSLIIGISGYILINNLYAMAENTAKTATTTTKAVASSSSPMPLIAGLVALIIIGAVIFMMTKKKDPKIQMPENSISPPQPGGKNAINSPTPKTPVATPPKAPVSTPVVTPKVEVPVTPPKIDTPPVSTASMSSPAISTPPKVEAPPVMAPPPVMTPPPSMNMPPVSMPSMPSSGGSSEGKPLFDAGKLDNDLDSIFNDPSSPSKAEQEQKKAPLFDSNQLEDDLDALFVEVNKKPDTPKEEKKGLFDSNQLSNDIDSLFSEGSSSSSSSSPASSGDNLADLFSAPSAPIETTPAPQAQSAFSLDDLNFLSTDTKKEEPKNEAFSLPSLDLSSLTNDSSSQAPKAEEPKQSSTFDLNDLSFLSTETKKEETTNDSFALPSFNLSDITGGGTSTPSKPPVVTPSDAKIDLTTTTMGLNISDYLNSIQKPEEKKEEGFSLSNTIPPHSLNVNDLNMNTPAVSSSTVSEAKSDGVISIGKMLVDQNALEEIIKKAEKGGKAGLTTTQVITAVKEDLLILYL
ncbi:MAG: hypothetical protein U0354_12545 [Candidatus Sericytochromatia bacterium]